MAQYWLQTPVENAKEVLQRFIDDNAGILTALVGKKVSYTENIERIFYSGYIPSNPYLTNKMYFGTWYFTSQESTFKSSITDGTSNIQTFDATLGALPCDPGHYPYIIWNKITALPNQPAYFVGYEFTVS